MPSNIGASAEPNLGFAHRWVAGPDARLTLLLLHGTGGDENGLIPLMQIDNALRRIAEGSYGYSEVSGKSIPVERLEALPTATRLVGE